MAQRDPYAQIAEFYDLEHDEHVEDVDFYRQYVETAGDPVLEVACGTGRIAVPIAEDGYRVVGIDVSMVMLERARARTRKAGKELAIQFEQADMLQAHTVGGGPFGVVIMALGALAHLPDQEAQIAALTAAHQSLDPRGVLLVDLMHASPERLHALQGGVDVDGHWERAGDEIVKRFSTHTVHPASQLIDTRIWYDVSHPGQAVNRYSASIRQRYVTPGELVLMLAMAGFEDVMLYGGYDLEPFEDSSERLIAAAEKTRTV